MGRSLQLLAQVGSPQFAKCVSLPFLFSSLSAPLLWMPTSTRGRKSAKSNVVVSLKDSGLLLLLLLLLHTTGHALLLQLSTSPAMPAMTAMTGNTTAHAELTTTAREKLRQRPTPLLWLNPSLWPTLTPSMATMGMAWGTPMARALATMAMDSDTVLAMVGVTSTDPPVVHHVFSS